MKTEDLQDFPSVIITSNLLHQNVLDILNFNEVKMSDSEGRSSQWPHALQVRENTVEKR